MFTDLEPFYGWLGYYNHQDDPASPFHFVEHNQFYFDRYIHTFPAHPLWDSIESQSLLVKILFARYEEGYAILELLGEWNDLFENDFKLLCENCLYQLLDQGVNRFIFICENVFQIYLEQDDYYAEFSDRLGDEGWMCLLRARQEVLEQLEERGVGDYFYWSPHFDQLRWRKLKPWELYQLIAERRNRFLLS